MNMSVARRLGALWLAAVGFAPSLAGQEQEVPAGAEPERSTPGAATAEAAGADAAPAAERAGAAAARAESPGPAAAEHREDVTFDVVRLFGVEGRTLVEIYSRIPTSAVSFARAGERWEASLAFDLTVRKGDEVVLEDSWTRTKTVADPRMLESSHIFFVETHAFLIPPGTYELAGAIRDAAGRELGSLRRTLQAPEENPPVSDLLLASRIVPDTAAAPPDGYDPLRKNRLVLNPNPGGFYSSAVSPLVFFYYEFENVRPEPLPLVRVLRFREPGADEVVKEVRTTRTYQPGWTVDFGAINVAGLREGRYALELSWEAAEGAELPEAYRGIVRRDEFVLSRDEELPIAVGQPAPGAAEPPGGGPGPAVPAADFYEGYAEAQLDSVFELLEVFFKDAEERLYRGLTPEGKKNFLNQFWARNDPTPGTPENEYRAEIDARLATIESQFASSAQQGYATPRGRIYLKHGKPDRRVERVLESGFSAPYEVWIYYDTGYKYVFLDEFRNRRYILLTSTDPEEQGRPDWRERLPREAVNEILRE